MGLQMNEIYKRDLVLPREKLRNVQHGKAEIRQLAQSLSAMKLTYTTFDGDHQQLASLMRQSILAEGNVPVNPPSILGYRDLVDTRQIKKGVMLDDLALLRRCDELWCFTNTRTASKGLDRVPEGALIELIYFRRHHAHAPIYFVDVEDLLEGKIVKKKANDFIDRQLGRKLAYFAELKSFVVEHENDVPNTRYVNLDPLDFKYAEWLRRIPTRESCVPLVPFLTVDMADMPNRLTHSDRIPRAWLALLRLCDSYVSMAPLHEQPHLSAWQNLVRRVASEMNIPSAAEITWKQLSVPKAILGERWPITSKEAADIQRILGRSRGKEAA